MFKISVLFFGSLLYSSLSIATPNDDIKINEYKIGVAHIEHTSAKLAGFLPRFFERIGLAANVNVTVETYPFKRSMFLLQRGLLDAHFPFVYSPKLKNSKLPYVFSTVSFAKVNFVLYTHKNVTVDINDLTKLTILTALAHVDLFDFDVVAVHDLKGAINMVNSGRVDGLIFADVVIDPFIKSQHLSNITRTFFHRFEVKALISKGRRGKDIDAIISAGVSVMKESGELARFTDRWSRDYDDWQLLQPLVDFE